MKILKDLTGQTFGRLTVLKLDEEKTQEKSKAYWICQCSCGKIKSISRASLNQGTQSCGCLRAEKMREKKTKDLVGQNFGELTCISFSQYKNNRSYWLCKCSCGSIKEYLGNSLQQGRIFSCGCKTNLLKAKAHFKNEIGQRYGELTVIGEEIDPKDNKIKNKCLCSCGNTILVPGTYLRSGNTKSCGCKKGWFSFEVQNILKWLQENNIVFRTEQTFPDLQGEKHTLRFDIAIYDNSNEQLLGCIEYNGKQHYESIDFFGGEEYFNILQDYDNRKKDYCKEHNIPLLILNYKNNHEQNIEMLKDFLNLLKLILKE